jgi:hypothetical protein
MALFGEVTASVSWSFLKMYVSNGTNYILRAALAIRG